MPLPAPIQKVVSFLRAGYPDGVPKVDYIPLFALLARRLSSEEVQQVVDELVLQGQIDGTLDIGTVARAVSQVTHEPALESDIQRVEARMTSAGWLPDPLTKN